jgi:eukaryotic-like serine/threonine-protein kinase
MIDHGRSGGSANRPPGCLDENDAVDFVQGRLERSRVSEIERHVDGCVPCRWMLSAVARATSAAEITGDARSGRITGDDSVPAGATRFLRPGQQLGRYAIGGLRGIGSMGVVYAARDAELDRAVALKLLRNAAGAGAAEVGRARLVREAQALARLSHPNVVAIHDIGVHENEVFVAMELVEGAALDEWLHAGARTPAEILDVIVGAGRGLVAAHAAGLIHRDVKPENILVGTDGRARMTDFGLVRVAASDESPLPATGDDRVGTGAAASHLTRTGSLLGTPAYMSPEQLSGLAVGHASDQFSFAVTLYEALYGERPFRGNDLVSLRERVVAGVVEIPHRRNAIPARVRRALRRALSVDPRRRYPSMDALLADLGGDDRRARRRVGVVAGASAAAALAAAAALWIGAGGNGEPPCAGAASKLEGVWDAVRRGAVERAFIASGEAYSGDAFARVARGLDGYTGAWVAMHTDTCAATAVRGEQSAEVLTLRMACLGKDLDLTRQLVDLFMPRGFTGTAQAVIAVDGLPRLAECADIAALRAAAPLPVDPVRRARLGALDARVAEIKARWLIDDFATVRQAAPGLVAEASSIGYAPMSAAVLLLAGEVESVSGAARAAEDKLYQALWAAEAANDSEQVALAWIRITRVVGVEQQRYAEGERLLRNAEQAVERATAISPSAGTALRVALLSMSGTFAYAKGDDQVATARASEALALEEQHFGRDTARAATLHDSLTKYKAAMADPSGALVENQRALAIAEQRFGTGPYLVKFHGSAAFVLLAQGKHTDAVSAFERALAIAAQVFTTDTPQVGVLLGALAMAHQSLDHYDRADPLLQRALAIFVKTRGAESGEASVALRRLGVSAQYRGQLADAQSYFERSLAISERIQGPAHIEVAQNLSVLGEVLVARGQHARAVPLLERAVSIMEARRASGDHGYPFVLAHFRFVLAQALWAQPRERPRARAVLRAARDLLDPSATDRRVKAELDEIVEWSKKNHL